MNSAGKLPPTTWFERLLLQFPRRISLVLSIVLLGLLILSAGGYMIALRLNDAGNAQSDNTTWMLVQTEVEVLKLEVALHRAQDAAGNIAALSEAITPLRQAFDIYLSRIALVDSYAAASTFYPALKDDENWRGMQVADQRLRELLDVPDADLVGNIGAALELVASQRRAVRQFAINGLESQNERSLADREALGLLLLRSAVVALGLIVLLMVTTWAMFRMTRRLEHLFGEANRARTNLERTFSAALEGVVVAQQDGGIRNANATAEKIFGLDQEALRAANFRDLLIPPEGAKMGDDPGAALRDWLRGGGDHEGDSRRIEMEIRRGDGSCVPVELSVTIGRDASNAPVWLAFMRDISERWRYEQSLRAARDDAVETAQTKSRFLAVMSHEMRTPLNGLIAALELLRSSPPLNERQLRFLDVAERSAGLALAQINDVLELARLESGGGVEPDEVFNLTRLVHSMADQVTPLAQQNGNRISLDLPPEQDAWLIGARRSLLRVLMNLTGNAVKFTTDGAIHIRAGIRPGASPGAGAGQVTLCVVVRDSGIGIAPEKLAGIFNPFGALQTSYNRQAGGSGLGLGIVSLTVERMGGEVGVESAPGRGSSFHFRVPLRRAVVSGAVPQHSLAEPGLPEAREILIVEDNETNRLVLREMLLHLGQSVDEAVNGMEAVAAAAARRYALILMDVSMPVLDGIAATQMIRAGTGPSAQARIVALTAHSLPEELERFRAGGVNEVLSKPVTLAALRELLAGAPQAVGAGLREAGSAVTAAGPGIEPTLDPAVIGELQMLLTPARLVVMLQKVRREGDALRDALMRRQDSSADVALAARVHQMQGVCAMIGAWALTPRLQKLTEALEHGDTPAFAQAALPASLEWRAVCAALDALEAKLVVRAERSGEVAVAMSQ